MKTAKRMARRLWPLALLAAGQALAAGGHHGVDDAAILDPGQCELESWLGRAQGGERLLHAGANCRVGPVELGAAGEHARGGGASATAWNLEVKWATELAPGFSVGLDLQPVREAHARPRHTATRFAALATWAPREDLALHLNVGRDFVRSGDDTPRWGIGADWSPARDWWLTAERFTEARGHLARVGVRWAASEAWTLDLSRAHRISGPALSNWTFGVTWSFDR